MKNREEKIRKSIIRQVDEKGVVTIVDTFIDVGILDKVDYENWRKGRITYLERVCKGSLGKLNKSVNEIYRYTNKLGLKQSFTYYRKYGKGKIKLRFSKNGIESIEKRYATHFIAKKLINKQSNKQTNNQGLDENIK